MNCVNCGAALPPQSDVCTYCKARNDTNLRRFDVLPGASRGIPLVLLNPSLAVGKYEVSRLDMSAFCAETKACTASRSRQPAADLEVNVITSFAAWLTRKSGFTYRLPTEREWKLATSDVADKDHFRST